MSQYYAVTFVDRPLSIDISKVPDDRQQNDSSPTRASFPNAARQTAASSRPLRWHVRYYSWPDAGFKQPPRDWQAMIDSTPLAEVDQEGLQHDWGSTAPHASVPVDHFALVATSDFDAGDGGDYALEVASDDGVQVYIDNELVLWRSGTSNRIEKTLTPGRHTLKVEYFEIDGSASLSIQVMRMIAE
jgi:hypothetical protein